jgi:fructokinase
MQASYVFERGADRAFTRDSLMGALPRAVELYQIGGFCPILADDAAVWSDVVKAAIGRGATVSFDINVREKLVDDETGYRERLGHFLDLAHVIKLSEDDHEWLHPGQSIEAHADALLERPNCELVVVTLGEGGSRAFTREASTVVPIYKPDVFGDTVGAGDSLMAGILTWLGEAEALTAERLMALGEPELGAMLRFGAVVAGINCGRKGCQPPSRAEVDAVLGA